MKNKDTSNRKFKKFVFYGAFIIIAALVAYSYFQKNSTIDRVKKLDPTPSTFTSSKVITNIDKTNWEKHSGTGFFKFTVLAPKMSYVCIGETAGESNCFPTGIYLNNSQHFPYGISFKQTVLDPNLDQLIITFNFKGYERSDINFDNARNQIMVKGSGTEIFYDKDNKEIKKNVSYTRYLFTKDNYIYMPTIYTNEFGDDYELYQNILSTWKFE